MTSVAAARSGAAAAPDQTIISVDGVAHSFGAVEALQEISLNINKGEMVSFIGPSGCGKSTLLNVIGGLLEPTRGKAIVDGTVVKAPLPTKVAYIFQESALLPWANVIENIEIALEFQGVPVRERRERAREALESVRLEDFALRYPHELSGGMKQRIALARGLSLRTEVILMDEPFAALDEQTRLVFGEELSVLLARTGKTIILVTHSLSEAVFLSDRIFVFSARPGRIKSVLEVDRPHPRTPDFMLSPEFGNARNELYSQLREEVLLTLRAQGEAGMARP